MPRTRIKICGITRPQDAIAAAQAGTDAIGMILHADAALRHISLDTAREVLSALPPMVTPIGVFVDAPPQLILDTAKQLRLRYVQLHGRETPQQVAMLGDLQVIKALNLLRLDQGDLEQWRAASCQLRAFLLETGGGGSGVESNWQAVATALRDSAMLRSHPFIAAGGLRPDNVRSAIELIRPWAVDVSSGVEESVGIKSSEKIQVFCEAVRAADQVQ